MKLDWRQGVLYVTTIGMEGSWLYALIALLNEQVADGRLSTLGFWLLYPAAFGVNKFLKQLRWPRISLHIISWLVWAIAMLLTVKIQLFSNLGWLNPGWLSALPQAVTQILHTFKPELLILTGSALLWWLGRRLAYLRVDFTTSVAEFQFGLAILLIVFFVTAELMGNLANLVPLALTFFTFALLGVSIAHALEGTSWLSGLFQGHWLGLLLISISLILIVGLLVGSLATPHLLNLILAILKWLWGLIIKVLAFVVSLFPEPEPIELPPALPMPEAEPDEISKIFSIPEPVRSSLRLVWSLLTLGIILLALWRISSDIFSWLRRKLAGMAGAEFEPMPGAFRADLLSLLKRILHKLRRLRFGFRLRRKPSSIFPEMASVRQIYRQFLKWTATRGYPRHTSQTPREYFGTMVNWLPEAQNDLDFITQQYIAARYGTSLPTQDALHHLNESWHKIRRSHLKKPGSAH